mgnify:CR=1 FL=1
MTDRITIAIADGVADVRLTRADKMNALDPAMFQALADAAARLKGEKSVRAVVISGEGRAFCAGLDMSSFASVGGGGKLATRTHGISNLWQFVVQGWREVPAPVIAAVHGVAFGGGFQLALGADIRYVAPDTKMSVMEIKWGLVPDMAGMALMRHLCREDIARELTYTGRVFSGEEAFQYGFATRLEADPRAAALATAREIAGKSPHAIRAAKRLFDLAQDGSAADLLMAESVEQDKLLRSPNQTEAVMSNMEKRAANYRDPE